MSEVGVELGAVLLMALGEQEAVEVFKHLSPKEVQKLGKVMAGFEGVPQKKLEDALRRFQEDAAGQSPIDVDSDRYLRSVLTKALGDDKAAGVIDQILQSQDNAGIEGLKWLDAVSLAELIKGEHPQIIATILVHLDPDQASEVLAQLHERLRNDVMLRVATLEGVQPAALKELNEVLTQMLASGDKIKKSRLGGIDAAADILNYLGGTLEASVSAFLKESNPELAQQIQDKMFVFDNLLDLDDRAIQLLLREVQSDSLILALKGVSEEMKNKIFKNMSQRAAEMLKEDLESKGPVKLSEVEAEQKEILKVVRKLADEGQIVLGGKGDEGLVQ